MPHDGLVKSHQKAGRAVGAVLRGHRPGGDVPGQVELLPNMLHIILGVGGDSGLRGDGEGRRHY